jgi:hypothetical protein
MVAFVTLAAAVGIVSFARRGGILEGWSGSPDEQLLGWTLLASPYVFAVWMILSVTAWGLASRRPPSDRVGRAVTYIVAAGVTMVLGLIA